MWRTFLPQESENVRLHSSYSIENATHYSQSSCENATPLSSTSPLASYKEVPPPPDQDKVMMSVLNCAPHLTLPLTPSIVEVGEGKPM